MVAYRRDEVSPHLRLRSLGLLIVNTANVKLVATFLVIPIYRVQMIRSSSFNHSFVKHLAWYTASPVAAALPFTSAKPDGL